MTSAIPSMKELRELNRKEYYSKFQEKMHVLMLYVTWPLLKTTITPNQITVFWIILQIIAAAFMMFGVYYLNVIGVLLYTFAMLLDYVDGQIARVKKKHSFKGIFLEEIGIYTGSPLFILGLSWGVTHSTGDLRYFLLGITASLCFLYSKLLVVNPLSYSEEKRAKLLEVGRLVTTRSKNKKLAWLAFLFRRSQPLNVLFFGILFNLTPYVVIIYTILYFLELLRRLYLQFRFLHKLDKGREEQQN